MVVFSSFCNRGKVEILVVIFILVFLNWLHRLPIFFLRICKLLSICIRVKLHEFGSVLDDFRQLFLVLFLFGPQLLNFPFPFFIRFACIFARLNFNSSSCLQLSFQGKGFLTFLVLNGYPLDAVGTTTYLARVIC